MHKLRSVWFLVLVHIIVLTPLAVLVWDFTQGQLTANPIREIQLRSGRYTLILLVLTLTCTPVYHLFRLEQILVLRRLLGLYTFAYASLHLLNFIGLDYRFNFAMIWEDIGTKRFVLVGFIAFLILLALAVTSTAGWKRRLGKNWKWVQRLIFGAALLTVLHFVWLTKVDLRVPLIYTGIVALLLIVRIPGIAKAIMIPARWRKTG